MQSTQFNQSNIKNNQSKISNNMLPSITAPIQISYSQRYEHMTKIANYNEMNEGQIWKQYQKLRVCLKQLNDQVLYHMQRKAYTGLSKQVVTKQVSTQIAVLQQENRLNQQRLSYFTNQFYKTEQRVNYLSNRRNIIEELNAEAEQIENQIKKIRRQNKDSKRKQKLLGRDLQTGPIFQMKLIQTDQYLAKNQRKLALKTIKFNKINDKIIECKEKTDQLQKAIELRLQQFGRQQDYIAEQINFERFQQLKQQKQSISKYEPIYKRNYLQKLKQLEGLVNSIKRHQQIIQQTQVNIITVRNEVQTISSMIGASKKRTTSSLALIDRKNRAKQNKTVLMSSIKKDTQLQNKQQAGMEKKEGVPNDKNTQEIMSTSPTQLGGKTVMKEAK